MENPRTEWWFIAREITDFLWSLFQPAMVDYRMVFGVEKSELMGFLIRRNCKFMWIYLVKMKVPREYHGDVFSWACIFTWANLQENKAAKHAGCFGLPELTNFKLHMLPKNATAIWSIMIQALLLCNKASVGHKKFRSHWKPNWDLVCRAMVSSFSLGPLSPAML